MTASEFSELVRCIDAANVHCENGDAIDAIAITSGGVQFVHHFTPRGYGLHELRSLSKLVVALCVGTTINSGRYVVDGEVLHLDTRVWPVLRRRVLISDTTNIRLLERMTIRHLLTQTTGFSSHQVMLTSWLANHATSRLLSAVLNEPFGTSPGEKFVYSNASAFILSAFLHEIAGESLHDIAARDVLAPLGISEYSWVRYGPYCAGATGLYLSIDDTHKLGTLILQDGVWNGVPIVADSFLRAMLDKQVDVASEPGSATHPLSPIGYGFLVWVYKDGWFWSGAGGQYLVVMPHKRRVVSVLSHASTSAAVLARLNSVL